MAKIRLDQALALKKMVTTRSQAESYIKLGWVKVNQKVITKPGFVVSLDDKIKISDSEQYVSRAALKLKSASDKLKLDFTNMVVLDVGSSTGGFTQFALLRGAKKVIAVDVGSEQLHPSLRGNEKIELHEKTDIRDIKVLSSSPDIVLIDVSFISMRQILPSMAKLSKPATQIVAMLKPQFEATKREVNKGVIKNDTLRRKIIKDFELWLKDKFIILAKADSEVTGTKGNLERFYLLKIVK